MVYFRPPQPRSKSFSTKQIYWAAFIGVFAFFVLFFARDHELWLGLLTDETDLVVAIASAFFLLAPPLTFLIMLFPSILGGKLVHHYYKKSGCLENSSGLLIGVGIGVSIGLIFSPIGTLFYDGHIYNLLLNGALAGGLAGYWYSQRLKAHLLKGTD